ncbi:hypothetical protein [Tessaracoccus oleiagri]|uniref:Uncharacterized protein n=1 Tax=Tessaracoccus oleiagri TaxID=686624 RepID=A0A1G9H454_9ACTN|nr:hypothetical protein [Tessaracoccus oleiagri]SDL07649.1 hypothetical protein SAMN04488242_0063 [Tessaracoccus oleiagri]
MRLRTLAKAAAMVVAIAALLAALLWGWIAWSVNEYFTGRDPARFDTVSAELARNRPAYDAAAARVLELSAQTPGTTRVSMTEWHACRSVGGAERCEDTSPADAQRLRALREEVAIWQAKDADRVFFRFYGEDSPTVWLMYSASDRDPGAFARDRGFRSLRIIDEYWTVLGPIPDDARDRAQWNG